MFRLGEDWNDLCSQPTLKQTNELILSPMNVNNIPPLLANAVIKKPDEPTLCAASGSASTQIVHDDDDGRQTTALASSAAMQSTDSSDSCGGIAGGESSSSSSAHHERSNPDQFPSMANFLPDNSFFYNEKNCYIFPGAEIWWNKDSDLESTSSDSSINDDDDDDDIEEMEIATIEHNEMIGDVEQTLAVENLLENTEEDEFNKYLLKRNASTSLEHIHIKESDADELSPKRLKMHADTLEIDHLQQQQQQCTSDDRTSKMCKALDISNSNSSSSSDSTNTNTSTSDTSLTTTTATHAPSTPQNEVFSPKL